ncbi:Glycoprotein gp2 [Micromonospora noduli]|nr:Glycoprotein gp2 [Micromonospora noduli]
MHDNPPSVPDFTQWPSFPFEGDLHVKQLDDPVPVEPPRKGEGLRECTACNAPDDAYIWVGERWRVRAMDRPTGLPMVLILESRTHLDLGDLPNLLAAELGVMTVRLERAIRSLDGVARVHVNRWGDGSAHLHMWFLARPYGRLQLRGTFLSLWDSILPPISEAQWRENLALVAAWLAEFGGRPLAEPPRIQWQAPSSLLAQSAAADAAAAAEAASAAAAGTEAVSVIEAAEEIPEPALDSTPDPTDADSGPRAEPVVEPDAGSGSTTTTVTDSAAEPARSVTVSGPAAEPARSGSVTNLSGIPASGTRNSTAAASGSAATTATDGLHVGPAEAPTAGPRVGPASGSADEAGSANPAASDPANGGASGEAVSKTVTEKGAGIAGAAAPADGSDTPDVRAAH